MGDQTDQTDQTDPTERYDQPEGFCGKDFR
jgi:hypothetical protein